MIPGTWLLGALLLPQTAGSDGFADHVTPFLTRHCTSCHGGEDPESGLALDRHVTLEEARAEFDLWDYARERVLDGDMPPRGSARPEEAETQAFLGWVDDLLASESPAPRDPGRPKLRRLNHLEYTNSVRDLFGVEFPAEEFFPADGVAHGFRTSSEALSLSELHFEKYVEAAEHISEEAVRVDEPSRRRRFGSMELEGARDRGGAAVLVTHGDATVEVDLPRDGIYVVRARAFAQQAGDELARMSLSIDGRALDRFSIAAEPGASEVHEIRAFLRTGTRRFAAGFLNDYYDPEHEDPKRRDRNLHVVWLEVEGPLDRPRPTAFQERVDSRFPPSLGRERLAAVLRDLAPRVWRRPFDEAVFQRLLSFAQEGEDRGFDTDLRRAVFYLCASPHFLLRVERDAPGPIDPHALATRLAGFVWSTTPDAELLVRASDGSLTDDAELRRQLSRLLEDPRSRSLTDGFARGWLHLDSLETARLDPDLYPAFEELRPSMMTETLLTFDHLLREDASLWELLEGEATFVDERLATHYGIEGVRGPRYRRVSLAGTPRRGLLGQASVLALTSDPTRTSPVKRGKWVLDVLLGAPPPAPPPGADDLDESEEAVRTTSMRERLELHRADPNCAACHQRMDPLGFGLENYDALGGWRERDGAFEIDATGVLPDGRSFDGPLELTRILREDDAFLRTLTERMLVYATGRGLERTDRPYVHEILTDLDPDRPTLRRLIEGVVLSAPFRERGPRPVEERTP